MSSGHPETRKKIMETTRRLLETSQGKTVRLEDIAQAAGVSRQAIYLHFGSRVGLMVATVQYIDESAGLMERTQRACQEEDGLAAVGLFIDIWAGYVPTIYDLARQLLTLRGTDEGAAAAWEDRMDSLRNGPCRFLIERLERDGRLASEWDTETAVDLLWTFLSIQTWETLVIECGWSKKQYATTLKQLVQRMLVARP
jgi:AcrR family transcriptional regulator